MNMAAEGDQPETQSGMNNAGEMAKLDGGQPVESYGRWVERSFGMLNPGDPYKESNEPGAPVLHSDAYGSHEGRHRDLAATVWVLEQAKREATSTEQSPWVRRSFGMLSPGEAYKLTDDPAEPVVYVDEYGSEEGRHGDLTRQVYVLRQKPTH